MRSREKLGTRDHYDALGGMIYDLRYEAEQAIKYDEIFRNVNNAEDHLVLDDGCGTGLLLQRVRSYVVGIDLSYLLLSKARSRLRRRRKIHLMQGDAEHLPIRDMIFDSVFAVTLIQNVPSPKHTLIEMGRVAKKGSDVVVTALKMSFTVDRLEELIRVSGLKLKRVIQDEGMKDWMALVTT
jgi:ubiquinone/menaquinone biosynthesis C-methylase UbiE